MIGTNTTTNDYEHRDHLDHRGRNYAEGEKDIDKMIDNEIDNESGSRTHNDTVDEEGPLLLIILPRTRNNQPYKPILLPLAEPSIVIFDPYPTKIVSPYTMFSKLLHNPRMELYFATAGKDAMVAHGIVRCVPINNTVSKKVRPSFQGTLPFFWR
jgi:hypothetical protein